ncbi:hypothetical protein BYT27DRAFT_7249878 [Phlegmacium glaucopus]|nr:hypothetical protein BYT27DRAFT_7249878 [Phlegmacium glaucopus]
MAAGAGTSNLPLEIVSVVSVDRTLATVVAGTEAFTVSSPVSVPISASGPTVPGKISAANNVLLHLAQRKQHR